MFTLASGSWLTRERIRRVAAIVGLGSICLIAWLLIGSRGTLDWLGRPLGTDFSDVWTAGRTALEGHGADAWNWDKHFAVQKALHGPGLTEVYAWHYPPPFLLVAAGFATLPYVPALIAWQLATLIPFTLMMQRIVPGRDSLLLTLAAPVTLFCVTQGMNGFLTALLLGGGLMLLERRPFAAGLLFGCLIYKPQFGLIIPVVLLAGRHWKAILGAFASAALLVGVTLLIWGWPVWQAFIDSVALSRSEIIESGVAGFYKIVTPFAAARLWGAPVSFAYAVQFAFTALAIASVIAVSRTADRPALRNSVICAAVVISTPYAFDYDMVVLLPALAWLYLDGRDHGFLSWDATLMAFAWIAPLFARAAAQFAYLPLGVMSSVCLGVIAMRRFTQREGGGDRSHSRASTAADKAATTPC
jgi:hypothetical protein